MFSFETLLSFLAAAIIICIIPGSTVSAVVSTGLARGLKAGIAIEIGAQLGRLMMITVVALALEAVRIFMLAAFDWIKLCGAAYLAYLGLRYFMTAPVISLTAKTREKSFALTIWSGFFVTWTNPKSFLFFGAFLPQFVTANAPAGPQIMVLGFIEMAIAFVTDSLYLVLANTARRQVTGRGAHMVNRIAGLILIGAAVWLATSQKA